MINYTNHNDRDKTKIKIKIMVWEMNSAFLYAQFKNGEQIGRLWGVFFFFKNFSP